MRTRIIPRGAVSLRGPSFVVRTYLIACVVQCKLHITWTFILQLNLIEVLSLHHSTTMYSIVFQYSNTMRCARYDFSTRARVVLY